MRILHISTRLILGGSQENTVLSCEGQARLGHDVHLAFGPIYGPEGSMLERVEKFRTPNGRRITTHVVPSLIRPIHPWQDFRCWHQLRRLIFKLRPDIVHTHSSKAGILGRSVAWREEKERMRCAKYHDPFDGTPRPVEYLGVVHTIHGPPFYDGQNPLVRQSYIASEKYAARHCHLIVSVADAMTQKYLAAGIGRPEQYVTVFSGMEVERYQPLTDAASRDAARQRLGLAPDDFVIGTVARLATQKGHDDLLDALGDELKRRPNLKLLWVGDGWLKDKLITRAKSLGLTVSDRSSPSHSITPSPSHITITGLVPSEQVPSMMQLMDVLAHPSYREGLPRTVPQALLCRVCPVAYDVDGTREACIDMQTGRLVPLGDRAALRESILWLHDHPAERAAMALRGEQLCRARFSAATMVAELEKVYERALTLAHG